MVNPDCPPDWLWSRRKGQLLGTPAKAPFHPTVWSGPARSVDGTFWWQFRQKGDGNTDILGFSLLVFTHAGKSVHPVAVTAVFFDCDENQLQHRPGLWARIRMSETSNYWILVSCKPNCFPQYLWHFTDLSQHVKIIIFPSPHPHYQLYCMYCSDSHLSSGTCCPRVFMLYILIDWGFWASCQGLHYHFYVFFGKVSIWVICWFDLVIHLTDVKMRSCI